MPAAECSAALSAPEQFHELFNGQTGVCDDAAERAGSQLLVVWDDGPGVRSVAAKDHVAAGLAAENESGALKGCADFKAR
jgi:hypothetical protein